MLARKSFLIFLTNIVGGFLGLIGLFAIGRYMTPGALGILGYTLGFVGIASFIGNLGFDSAHVKRVSEGRVLGDSLVVYTGVKVALALVFGIGVLVAALVWDRTQGLVDTSVAMVVLVVIYYVFFILRKVPTQTFDALRYAATTQTIILFEHIIKNPLVVVFALVFASVNGKWVPFSDVVDTIVKAVGVAGPLDNMDGAFMLGTAYTLALGVSFLAGVYLLRRHEYPVGRFDKDLARDYARFAFPIAILSAFATLSNHLDAFMIGYFWSSADVGYYFAARRITTTALIIPIAVGTMFFPIISELAARGERKAVLEVALSTQHYVSLVVVLVVMFMVMFPREGIHIFLSDSFLPATRPLQLLAVWTLLMAFTTVASSIVKGFDRPRAVAQAGIISLSANMLLNVVLIPDSFLGIPTFGLRATGATLATALAQVLQLALLLRLSHGVLGRLHFGTSVIKHLAAAAITMGVMHLAATTPVFGGLARFYHLGAMGVFGTVVYLGILILMRDVKRGDLVMLLDVVHPGKMAKYIRDEVRPSKGKDGK